MSIINETQFDAFFYSNRSDSVWRSLLETFSRGISNEEATYVDDGIFTIPGSNSMQSPEKVETEGASVNQIAGDIGFQTRQFSTQEPQATIFIKKKVFSTLRSQFDTKFLGDEEKFFLTATKQLFENKSNEIAAYERLLKIQKFLKEGVVLKEDIKALFAEAWYSMASNEGDKEKAEAMLRIIRANQEEYDSTLTRWILDSDGDDNDSNIGRGVGVIELTAFTNFSTNLSLNIGDLGGCNLSVEDPYHILFIKVEDIDKAMMQTEPQLVPKDAKNYFDEATVLDTQYANEYGNRYPMTIKFDLKKKKVTQPIFAADYENRFTASRTSVPTEARTLANKIHGVLTKYVKSIGDFEDLQTQRNKRNNYVRNKMLKFYNGKSIIQPMDSIHIFANSNTTLQSYSRAFMSELEVSNTVLEREKRRILKGLSKETIDNIPTDDYRASSSYRSMRAPEAFYGTQIFTGVVDSVVDNYDANAGKYVLNVSASNNLKWLKISRINKAPALVQQHGILEDPLTPYLIKPAADGMISTAALELLPENKAILNGEFAVSVKGGYLDGKLITEQDLKCGASDFAKSKVTPIIHAPGLRYRWKDGIHTATQQFFIRSPGIEYDSREDMTRLYGLILTEDVFSNLDSANIISILVTGQPYNFERFLRNALDAGNLDIRTVFNGGEDYFGALFNAIKVQNSTLGGFVPYATIGANRAQAIAQQLQIDQQVNKYNSERRRLNVDIAKLQDQYDELEREVAALSGRSNVDFEISKTLLLQQNLKKQIADLKAKKTEVEEIVDNLATNEDNISQTTPCKYNATPSDPTVTSESGLTQEEEIKDDLDFFLYKRKSDVRYNRDSNLFVVSDEYDKDTDIQGLTLRLKGQSPELYETSAAYTIPLETCSQVAQTVNFEFFADANGNIHFRPPQYNKTPLSILRSIFNKKKQGWQQYPPWLERIFENKLKLAERRLDEINALIIFKEALLEKDVKVAADIVADETFPKNQLPPNTTINQEYVDTVTSNHVKIAKLENDIENLEDEALRLNELAVRTKEQASTPHSIEEREKVEKLLAGQMTEDLDINPLNYHLIEFDNINTIGYASGRRFIINDDVIINYNFTEGDEGIITRYDVMGRQNIVGDNFGDFGMPQYIWAGGTYFDLWQQYGCRYQDVQVPYFEDA